MKKIIHGYSLYDYSMRERKERYHISIISALSLGLVSVMALTATNTVFAQGSNQSMGNETGEGMQAATNATGEGLEGVANETGELLGNISEGVQEFFNGENSTG